MNHNPDNIHLPEMPLPPMPPPEDDSECFNPDCSCHHLASAQARQSRRDPDAGHDWIITRHGDAVDIRVRDKAGKEVAIPADVDEAWRLALGLLDILRSRP